jgi:hypothetical protein
MADPAASFHALSVATRVARRDPPRWVAGLGLAAALTLVASPFLDWLEVAPFKAARLGGAFQEQVKAEGPGTRATAWAQIGARLVEREALTGLDLVAWSRAARERIAVRDAQAGDPDAHAEVARGWTALAVAILGSAGAALVLTTYLAFHRLARYRIPMRILAGVAGLVALVLAAGLDWLCRPILDSVRCGPGQMALLLGGAGLLGSVVASLTLRSVLGVLVGIAVTAGALGALAALWVAHGGAT